MLVGNVACAKNKTFEIEGRIAVKGSSPHTYLVIESLTDHTTYKIINPIKFDLLHKQKKLLKIQAKKIKDAIEPDFPMEIEVIAIDP